MTQKLGSLELGRFIAASLVVVSHVLPTVNDYAASSSQVILPHLDFGPLGVQYFFVLSGFVMASTHYHDFGHVSAVPKFLWRRICRIYPVFWLAMLVPITYEFATLKPEFAVQLLSLVPVTTNEYLPPAWTLRYEAAFYLVFSLCLLPYIGRPLLVAWMLAVLWTWSPVGVLGHILPPPPHILEYMANSPADHFFNFDEFYFFGGVIAGLVFVRFPQRTHVATGILAASFCMFLIGLHRMRWGSIYGSPDVIAGMGLTIGALMLSLAWLETNQVLKIGAYAGRLGAISYPLYILHWSLFWIGGRMIPHLELRTPALIMVFVVYTAVVFLVAAAVTYLFDQPVQRWLRGRKQKNFC